MIPSSCIGGVTDNATATATTTTSTQTANNVSSICNDVAAVPPPPLAALDPNTQTMTRIGSIGRTTIACITPAVNAVGGANNNNNGNNKAAVGLLSTAALAAAGVELDAMDDSTTEVIVKIENSTSSQDGEEEDGDEDDDDEEEEPHTEDGEGDGDEDDDDYNYDLKLSSPISWAFDTVKIEDEEEFEDIVDDGQDNTNDDVDDLLTTAAAAANVTSKNAAAAAAAAAAAGTASAATVANSRKRKAPLLLNRSASMRGAVNKMLKSRGGAKKKRLLNNSIKVQQTLNHQQQQQQQQVLHLPTIPATITSITTTAAGAATGGVPAMKYAQQMATQPQQGKSSAGDFQATLSDDKKYRILIQNQRMRKESLEHTEDMIYNAEIEKPWICKNCNRNYKWKNSLKCHLKNECGQPPRYFCSKLCGYATNVHSNLKRHLNTKCKDRTDEDSPPQKTETYTLVLQKQE